ncbi:MAG: transposase [Planctomycetia bacterium]|nr:transposase [Planctomycetia bacterium]
MGTTKLDVKAAVATLPRYSEAFKRDAVRLVTEEGCKFAAAAQAVDVSDPTLRLWRKKLGSRNGAWRRARNFPPRT